MPEWLRWEGEEYRPTFNFWEKDGTYHVEADLPGVKKEDISINVEGNMVTASGKREYEEEREGKNYSVKESRSGAFSRSFQLPGDVAEENLDATCKDGILKVDLPLKEGAQSRKKIAIKS